MTNPKFRVGILGLGNIGQFYGEWTERDPRYELFGGTDRAPAKRQAFGERFRVPTVETLAELLAGDVDVIFVCTPNVAHVGPAIEALEAGKVVFCEPPAIGAEAGLMAAAAERNLPRLRQRFPEATGNVLYGRVYRHALGA